MKEVEARLRTYPPTVGLALSRYGEASDATHRLLAAAASCGAQEHWRTTGARSATEARAQFVSRLRRRWGAVIHRETARVIVERL